MQRNFEGKGEIHQIRGVAREKISEGFGDFGWIRLY